MAAQAQVAPAVVAFLADAEDLVLEGLDEYLDWP